MHVYQHVHVNVLRLFATHQKVSPSEHAVLVESLPQTAVSSLSLTPPRLKGLDHLLSGTD